MNANTYLAFAKRIRFNAQKALGFRDIHLAKITLKQYKKLQKEFPYELEDISWLHRDFETITDDVKNALTAIACELNKFIHLPPDKANSQAQFDEKKDEPKVIHQEIHNHYDGPIFSDVKGNVYNDIGGDVVHDIKNSDVKANMATVQTDNTKTHLLRPFFSVRSFIYAAIILVYTILMTCHINPLDFLNKANDVKKTSYRENIEDTSMNKESLILYEKACKINLRDTQIGELCSLIQLFNRFAKINNKDTVNKCVMYGEKNADGSYLGYIENRGKEKLSTIITELELFNPKLKNCSFVK